MKALSSEATVAIIGAGTMGAGIAQVAAQSGHTVLLYDAAPGAASKGIENISAGLDNIVKRGKIDRNTKEAIVGRIQPVSDINVLAPAALVIEAIIEDEKIKQELFATLESICDENTIFASNTSSISITLLASKLKRPENFLGMHFFNPAPIMKLVEIVSGLATSKDVAESVFLTAEAWGKKTVHVKSTPGFIVNRVARPFYAEALRVLQEQAADVATIDAVVRESGGFRMGPFELMDLIGHDVNYSVTQSVFNAYYGDKRFQPSLIQKELVLANFLGRKNGRGFYDYSDDAEKIEPKTMALGNPPDTIELYGELTAIESLVDLLGEFQIDVKRTQSDTCYLKSGDAIIALSDGRLATKRAADEGHDNLVLFDLAFDYESCDRIAIAAADQCSEKARDDAAGLFQAINKKVSLIDDIPGLIVLRTVAMLANEGADAVGQGVCELAAVDVAMKYGVNYPMGPMQWADNIGVDYVVTVLENLKQFYWEDRYRVSSLLQRNALTNKSLL